jgi:hypothetical protein
VACDHRQVRADQFIVGSVQFNCNLQTVGPTATSGLIDFFNSLADASNHEKASSQD